MNCRRQLTIRALHGDVKAETSDKRRWKRRLRRDEWSMPPTASGWTRGSRLDAAGVAGVGGAQPSDQDATCLLWCERFRPKCVEELAVAPKKRVEIETWLCHAWETCSNSQFEAAPCAPQVALIWGPSGAGASATLDVLATQRFRATVVRWTCTDRYFDTELGSASVLESFLEFLLMVSNTPADEWRGNASFTQRSSVTHLRRQNQPGAERLGANASAGHHHDRYLAVVEDFPVGIQERDHAVYSSFQSRLLALLAGLRLPLAWILPSDPHWRARQIRFLFGGQAKLPDQLPPWVRHIEFLPVTERRIQTVLLQIAARLADARDADRFGRSSALEQITAELARRCAGDIRRAIQWMQFCFVGQAMEPIAAPGTKPTKRGRFLENWKCLSELMQHFEGNARIGLSHMIARILYDKHQAEEWQIDDEYCIDDIGRSCNADGDIGNITLPTTATECSMFLSALHENFVEHFVRIEDVALALADFSYADMMQRNKLDVEAVIALQVAVCGVRCANRCHAPARFRPIRLQPRRYGTHAIRPSSTLYDENVNDYRDATGLGRRPWEPAAFTMRSKATQLPCWTSPANDTLESAESTALFLDPIEDADSRPSRASENIGQPLRNECTRSATLLETTHVSTICAPWSSNRRRRYSVRVINDNALPMHSVSANASRISAEAGRAPGPWSDHEPAAAFAVGLASDEFGLSGEAHLPSSRRQRTSASGTSPSPAYESSVGEDTVRRARVSEALSPDIEPRDQVLHCLLDMYEKRTDHLCAS